MLLIFRILFPLGFVLCLLKGAAMSSGAKTGWDVDGLFYAVLALFMAMGTGMVWASYLGEKIAEPLTNMLTSGNVIEGENHVARLINALFKRGWRRMALCVCFLESLRHPHAPSVPWVGLKNSPPGSWLEREFAWMVYRFSNAQHCVEAYRVLRRHGIKPGLHADPMVMLFIQADEQLPKEAHAPMAIPPAGPAPALQRDPRIRLFEIDESTMARSVAEREKMASERIVRPVLKARAAPAESRTEPPSPKRHSWLAWLAAKFSRF